MHPVYLFKRTSLSFCILMACNWVKIRICMPLLPNAFNNAVLHESKLSLSLEIKHQKTTTCRMTFFLYPGPWIVNDFESHSVPRALNHNMILNHIHWEHGAGPYNTRSLCLVRQQLQGLLFCLVCQVCLAGRCHKLMLNFPVVLNPELWRKVNPPRVMANKWEPHPPPPQP